MRRLMALQRLRRRFDFAAQKQDEAKALRAATGKRPPKRQRRR